MIGDLFDGIFNFLAGSKLKSNLLAMIQIITKNSFDLDWYR
jgi:hypothetical protein